MKERPDLYKAERAAQYGVGIGLQFSGQLDT